MKFTGKLHVYCLLNMNRSIKVMLVSVQSLHDRWLEHAGKRIFLSACVHIIIKKIVLKDDCLGREKDNAIALPVNVGTQMYRYSMH